MSAERPMRFLPPESGNDSPCWLPSTQTDS